MSRPIVYIDIPELNAHDINILLAELKTKVPCDITITTTTVSTALPGQAGRSYTRVMYHLPHQDSLNALAQSAFYLGTLITVQPVATSQRV